MVMCTSYKERKTKSEVNYIQFKQRGIGILKGQRPGRENKTNLNNTQNKQSQLYI